MHIPTDHDLPDQTVENNYDNTDHPITNSNVLPEWINEWKLRRNDLIKTNWQKKIRLIDFSIDELCSNGLNFLTQAEANLFIQLIKTEYEIRVGNAIADKVGENLIDELSSCKSGTETSWLEDHCPDFRQIVKEKQEELEQEIMEYKESISGLLYNPKNNEK